MQTNLLRRSPVNSESTDSVLVNDWHVLARSQDVKPETPIQARLLGTDVVLWRSEAGQICAWEDRCPHRSVRLSLGKVVDNTLVCSYHGMSYAVSGQCIDVPAHPNYTPPKQACVQTYQAQERYGLVYVCLGKPNDHIPLFPEWDNPDYRCYLTGPYPIRANGLRAIENFLDVAHFPFIHTDILGTPGKAEIADYEVSIDEKGVYARNIRVWQPDPYGTGQGGTFVNYDYWALRPMTAYLRKSNPAGEQLTLLYNVTPVEEDYCIAWMSGSLNYAPDMPEAEIVAFQDMIVRQDLENLESHNPQLLPLDSPLEFHVPSDRTSLAYRKWLKQLGLTYGVVR